MDKKFLLGWLIVFVVWMAGSFTVHGLLLHGDYAQLPHMFRPETEAQQFFPLMVLAHVIMAAAFVWIYSRGVETTPWVGQGLRFGAAIALLTVIPTYTIYYVVQPIPGGHVVKQVVYGTALVLVLGVITALIYRRPRGLG